MVEKLRILIGDDDPGIRFMLREFLSKQGYELSEAETGEQIIQLLKNDSQDLLILDVKLPDMDGIEVLRQARKLDPELIVVMITAYGSQDIAFQAIKEGAYDYFNKPFDIDELRVIVKRALEKRTLVQQIQELQDRLSGDLEFNQMIGATDEMRQVFDLIKKVSQNDVTVIIYGESGTGKELVAEAIHQNSPRRAQPFVKVNCVAIPETLLESEMFGHEKGAFSGAYQRKPGKFELSNKGTIFLDEIGDMPLSLQAKILRVLQHKEFERLGSSETIKVDVRIIVATNKDLSQAVEKSEFREDLYFRINVLPIYLPPLRKRKGDIPSLVDHFINYYNKKLGLSINGVTSAAMDIIMNYDWPGNIRELENALQRAMILSNGCYLTPASLPITLSAVSSEKAVLEPEEQFLEDFSVPLSGKMAGWSDKLEEKLIRIALKKANYHRQKTADLLGISRKSLHNKMVKYNLL